MKNFIYIFLLFIASTSLYSQPITWQKLYDGPFHKKDLSWKITNINDNNFYVVGETYSEQRPYVYILKINKFGDTIWTRTYDTLYGTERGIATNDGGLIFAACFCVGKIDSAGNLLWFKILNSLAGGYNTYNIIKNSNNNYLLCGRSTLSGIQGFIYEIDNSGNLLWYKTYPFNGTTYLNGIKELNGIGYLITGSTKQSENDTNRTLLMQIDYSGNIIWSKSYVIDNSHSSGLIISVINNEILICGNLASFYPSIRKGYLIKSDMYGNLRTRFIFNTTRNEEIKDFKIINNNRYCFLGWRDSSNLSSLVGKATITDSNCNIIYSKIFPTDLYVVLNSITVLSNKDIIFSGFGEFSYTNEEDIYIVRCDSTLYTPPIGIQNNSNNIVDYNLFQNFPNPFNPTTKISFTIPSTFKKENVKLVIYDVLGKELEILMDKHLQQGKYSIEWTPKNLPSGIYFCTLYINKNNFKSIKLILIK